MLIVHLAAKQLSAYPMLSDDSRDALHHATCLRDSLKRRDYNVNFGISRVALVSLLRKLFQDGIVCRAKISVKPGVNRNSNVVLIETSNDPLPHTVPFVSGINVLANLREISRNVVKVNDRAKAETTKPTGAKLRTNTLSNFTRKIVNRIDLSCGKLNKPTVNIEVLFLPQVPFRLVPRCNRLEQFRIDIECHNFTTTKEFRSIDSP